jgi:hypothetical protein
MLGHFPLGGAALGGSAGNVGISGTAGITEANDTAAATGTIAIKGTLSATLAGATLAATGALALKGTASITEAHDTVSATGTLALRGSASVAEADDTASSAGLLPVTGRLSAAEAGDTVSSAGGAAISATLDATSPEVTAAATGQVVGMPIIITHRGGGERHDYERRLWRRQEELRRTIDQAWKIANGEIDPVTLEPVPPADLQSLAAALRLIHATRDQAVRDEFMAGEARLQEEEAVAVLLLAA